MKLIEGIILGFACCTCIIAVGGCSSTPETQTVTQPPPSPPTHVVIRTPPAMAFETKTDTIQTVKSKPGDRADTVSHEPQIRYMVQIGAFTNPHNASRLQIAARERYHLPVLNDYDTGQGFYQIRIGFFESSEAARAFCERLRKEYPEEYGDSWVVQLKR